MQQRISVVVPAYNPGFRLCRVLEGIAERDWLVVVVDDGSRPPLNTQNLQLGGLDLVMVRNEHPQGVGAAIVQGLQVARSYGAQVAVVMAADAQMDPADLDALLGPILTGRADVVKGDRLSHPCCHQVMPRLRRLGNYCLTFLTRLATGYWGLMDSQCGFVAVRTMVLDRLPSAFLYPRYGFPNDFLAALSGAGVRVAQVVVAPRYHGEPSGLRPILAVMLYPLIIARSLLTRALAWWAVPKLASPNVHDAAVATPAAREGSYKNWKR